MYLATRDADAMFAELICADAQWLREEFDALIAASFRQPPAAPPPAPPQVPPRRRHPGPPGQGRPRSCPRPPPAPSPLRASGRRRHPRNDSRVLTVRLAAGEQPITQSAGHTPQNIRGKETSRSSRCGTLRGRAPWGARPRNVNRLVPADEQEVISGGLIPQDPRRRRVR